LSRRVIYWVVRGHTHKACSYLSSLWRSHMHFILGKKKKERKRENRRMYSKFLFRGQSTVIHIL